MPIDPGIALSVRPAQIPDPLESYARLMQIQHAKAMQPLQEQALQQQIATQRESTSALADERRSVIAQHEQDLAQKQRVQQSQETIDRLMSSAMVEDPTTGVSTFDRAAFEKGLIQGGLGHLYPQLDETLNKLDQSQLKINSERNQSVARSIFAVQQAGNTPSAVQMAAAYLKKNRLIDDSHLQPVLDAIHQDESPENIGRVMQALGQGMPEYQSLVNTEEKRKADLGKTTAETRKTSAEATNLEKYGRANGPAGKWVADYDQNGKPIERWVAEGPGVVVPRQEAPARPLIVGQGAKAIDPTTGAVIAEGNAPPVRPQAPARVETVNEQGQPVTKFVEPTAGQEFIKQPEPEKLTRPREVKPGSEEAFFIAYAKKLGKRPDDLSLEDQAKARQSWARADDKAPSIADDVVPLSEAGLNVAAKRYNKDGTLPPLSMGIKGAREKTRIVNRAAEIDPDADIAASKTSYKADSGALAQLQKQRDAIGSFEQTASKNIDIFLKEAGKVVDTGSPLLNIPVRMITGKMLGSSDQAGFDAARQVAVNEIAKITSNPNLAGSLSDSARHEVEAFNPREATTKQSVEVMRILKQDMANRTAAMDKQLAEIRGRIKSGYGSSTTPSQAAPAPVSPGGLFSYQDYLKAKGGK